MKRSFEFLLVPAEPPERVTLFALRIVDAVTLETIRQGLEVVAEGLKGKPIVNASGLFVWLKEDFETLTKVSIDPRDLPYEKVERPRAELQLPPRRPALTTIELPPRLNYPFTTGTTGLRGRLVERKTDPVPVANAAIRLRWLAYDGSAWNDAPTLSHTNANGDFVSILRLAPKQLPLLADGSVTVRLRARRDGARELNSAEFPLPQGRVTDPTADDPLTFAWDDLLP